MRRYVAPLVFILACGSEPSAPHYSEDCVSTNCGPTQVGFTATNRAGVTCCECRSAQDATPERRMAARRGYFNCIDK